MLPYSKEFRVLSQIFLRYGREWYDPVDSESEERRRLLDFTRRNRSPSSRNDGREERWRTARHGSGAAGGNHFRTRLHAQSHVARQAIARDEGRGNYVQPRD